MNLNLKKMKRKIYTLLFIGVVFIITTSAILSSGVGEPWGMWDSTGSPAHIGAGNCSGCHAGTVNSGGALTIVVKDENGMAVSNYAFNKMYTVDVTVAKTAITTFGFDAEIVTAANTNAGEITSMDTTEARTVQGELSTNITHSKPAKTSGSHTFSFNWKTPAADSGTVTIYAAGLAANGNGKNTGDFTYTSVKKLNASSGIRENRKAISQLVISPNPVSSSFMLSYNLKKAGEVNVGLYSLTGQKISTLLTAKEPEGLQKQVMTLPANISNGTYLLQITTNGNVVVEKLSVVK